MRQRRFRYIFYTALFILGATLMTYLFLYDDFFPKVPIRAKEVWLHTQDIFSFSVVTLSHYRG